MAWGIYCMFGLATLIRGLLNVPTSIHIGIAGRSRSGFDSSEIFDKDLNM